MARHTRARIPHDDKEEADFIKEREAEFFAALQRQAKSIRVAQKRLDADQWALRYNIIQAVKGEAIDITRIAEATGVSRQTIHRWVKNGAGPGPVPI